MVKKRRRSHAIKKLPAGHAYGSEGQTVTANIRGSRGARSSIQPDAESSADDDMHGLVALWRAVFAQAIMDVKSRRTKKEYDFIRNDAHHWLFYNQKDFKAVCELAGYEPDYLRRRVRDAQQRGFIWRAGDGQQPTKHGQLSGKPPDETSNYNWRNKRAHRRNFATRHVQLELF